ncbi:MAG TPA: acyl-CoA dehydrogenase family protein [Chloroflexota bacterium]|nr:acyl-CoA dehydrogenase family protein [Chloroflexota bacterium]
MTENEKYLEAARGLRPLIAAAGEQGDKERRLPREVAEGMADAGLFRMLLAQSIGGGGADLVSFLRVAEEVASADGSAGWCLVQGALSATQVAPFLPLEVAREVFSEERSILANGTGPGGRAVVEGNGYRLTGEWPFASGCMHATWLKGAAPVYSADGTPVRALNGGQASGGGTDGAPEVRTFLFPASEATLRDVWHVSGLRGTGSNTICVSELFVPAERSVCLAQATLREPDTLAALPYASVAAAGFCAVALGVARGALDAFIELAATKTARGMKGALREDPVTQDGVARAEAQLRAARAFLFEATAEAWEAASQGQGLAARQRAVLRLAATSGIHQAAQVVDTAYHAAGATAIFESQPFERRFRDVHAITQQTQARRQHFGVVGRVLLGVNDNGT